MITLVQIFSLVCGCHTGEKVFYRSMFDRPTVSTKMWWLKLTVWTTM